MPSIPELSASVIFELESQPASAWAWFSAHYYAQQVAQAPDALLVRIRQRFSLDALVATCQSYQHYTGQRGQAATHGLATLCWALLLKTLHGWSYRRTSQEIRTNTLARWFVGYRLNQKTLSYVTLQRFAVWVCEQQPRLFFNTILAQIDADFPAAATQAQVGDTFALQAHGGPQSRTALLRDACRRLLTYAQPIQALDQAALFGAAHERPEYQLLKPARDALEARTALAADACLRLVTAAVRRLPHARSLEWLALEKWLGILTKVLDDEFVFGRNAAGVAETVRPCTPQERGHFVLGSTTDPDATFRKHADHNDLGYNVQVAATADFVREIFAQTGATPDQTGVALLIAHQKTHLGIVPPKLIYDRAAGSPKIFHAVAQASDGKTQLVARLIDHSKNSERFGPLDFTLGEDGSLTCPNRQTTHIFYRSQSADGYNYRFSAAQCKDCPLWQLCRGQNAPVAAPSTDGVGRAPSATPIITALGATTSKTNQQNPPKATAYRQACTERSRSVFISHYRERQRTAILYTQTAQFKLDMHGRSTIERIIAALVRYNDARQAHAIGLSKADFQVRLAATAYNLKKWLKLSLDKQNPTRSPNPSPDSS